MSRHDYLARRGAPISDKDARVIGEVLERLHERHGYLDPEMVVSTASNPRSRLHSYFDWDDESAAMKHRLHYARMMMGWVVVLEYEATVEAAVPIRAFYNVASEDEGRRYVTLEVMRSNEDYRTQVVEHAMREAQGWASRYRAYSELSHIVEVIDRTMEERKAEKDNQGNAREGAATF